MRPTPRQILKRCLIAVAMTLAGMLAMNGVAQAAPSEAPKIVSSPSDPNTASMADFTYTVGDGETSVVSPLRYYCRIFDPATPPAATVGWAACGLSTDAQPLARSYGQANGNWTFQVAARETTAIDSQGPIASSTWTQNQAPPTEPPVVTSAPSDPNETSFNNVFNFGLDPAETQTVARFECSLDGAASWSFCSTNNPAGVTTGTTTYNNLANGPHILRVRAANGAGAGQVTTVPWIQKLPAPTTAPTIEVQPANPNTTKSSAFRSRIAVADAVLAKSMQCRVDGGAWSSCSSGSNVTYYPTNGDHKYEVQATGPGGVGPISAVEWSVDVPQTLIDPINVDDLVATRWDGAAANAQIGPLSLGGALSFAAGDVNGDGLQDLVIGDPSSYGGSSQVIFSDGKAHGSQKMAGIGPNRGFRILDPYSSGSAPSASEIGDQNGDGYGDLLIGGAGSQVDSVFVVYGVSDATDLPKCGGGSERCIDPSNMDPDQGYELSIGSEELLGLGASDFDGDGTKDIAIGALGISSGRVFIVKGKERSGTFDLNTPSSDVITINGPATAPQFGFVVNPLEDMNGDGKDEFTVLAGLTAGAGAYVFTGRSFEDVTGPIEASPLDPDDGFYIALAPFGLPSVSNAGDMNRDGRDDLLIGFTGLTSSTAGEVSIVYMPELPTTDPILAGGDLETGGGYVFLPGSAFAGIGMMTATLGDIDGDGLGDQLLGAGATPVNAFDQSGALYLVKGQEPGIESPIELGPEFNPELGVAIVSGKTRQSGFGNMVTPLGDLDGDGLPDFATGASGESNNGLNSSGSVYVIPGKSLLARSVTGKASDIADKAATVNGQVGTNGRAVEYHFEYGTTQAYGSATTSQPLPAGGSVAVDADLSGLNPNSQYHYRLVVTNELGFNRAGDDGTFTTKAATPPDGCAADSTKPGCPDYDRCKADSTQPGCADYNYCKANPTKSECQAPKAKLSNLIVNAAASKVKRGKKTTATATIVNAGTASASGLKICLSAPKKMVSGARCVSVGNLGAGATATRKFKVTVKKGAKKGKKVALSFKATANGLGAKAGKVSIKVG